MVDVPDDIPEARRSSSAKPSRQQASSQSQQSSVSPLWWVGLAVVALASGSFSAWYLQQMQVVAVAPEQPLTAKTSLANVLTSSTIPAFSPRQSLLGHRPYEEAPPDTLVSIVADGSIKLRESAASSFTEMAAAARADGVILQPVSGFRSIEQQEYLFFGIKREEGLRADERAEVSAPPGYSEHHTGYAIDIADGNRPDALLDETFEETDAFAWLEDNASFYSFELSFEKGDSGSVSYEPWQWRFVGDSHSLETFYRTAEPETTSALTLDEETATAASSSPRP
jgi:D-alanyl-D-alanine carboxypeptidase